MRVDGKQYGLFVPISRKDWPSDGSTQNRQGRRDTDQEREGKTEAFGAETSAEEEYVPDTRTRR